MKRNITGILLLDKPVGLTSNEALQRAKKIYNAKKAGHTGSLDPLASGMLPLCFGESTKFSQFLLESDKSYRVTGKLGEITASGDSEGEVIEKRVVENIDISAINKVLPKYRGKISQLPPMYSAIKHKGQPLYKLARQGIEVERKPRDINIYELKLLNLNDNLAEFLISCSKGTYVRTLIVDIGESLGCGAHVVALRRLTVGPYQEKQMVILDKLQELMDEKNFVELDKYLLPIESMLEGIPEVLLNLDMVHYICSGQPLLIPRAPANGLVRLKSKEGKFLGVGEILPDGKVAPKRLIR